jgi:hypothetical protein
MLFDFDEGIASIYALQLLGKGTLPLVGVRTSLNFYNPPLFIYIAAIPYALSASPLAAAGFLQLLFTGGLAWLLVALLRLGWRGSALLAIALAGFAPGPLLLANRLWGHSLIPTLSIVSLILVLRLAGRARDRWASLLLPVAVAAAQQVHFSGILLALDVALVLLLFRSAPDWRWFAGGVGIALATSAPYVVHLVHSDFEDVGTVWRLVTADAGEAKPHGALYLATLNSLSDFGGATAFQDRYDRFIDAIPWFKTARVALAAWLIAAVAIAFWMVARAAGTGPGALAERLRRHPVIVASLIWTAVPLAVFSWLKAEIVPAYWLVALPGPWLLAASAASVIAAVLHRHGVLRWRGARQVILICAVALPVAVAVGYCTRYLTTLAAADPAIQSYPAYRDQFGAARFITAHSAGKPVHITQGNRTLEGGIDYQFLYLLVMLEGDDKRFSPHTPDLAVRYVILNRAESLPLEFMSTIAHWTSRRFGLLEVRWDVLKP